MDVIQDAIKALAARGRVDLSAPLPSQQGSERRLWSDVASAIEAIRLEVSKQKQVIDGSVGQDNELHNMLPVLHKLVQKLLPVLRQPPPNLLPQHNPVPVLTQSLRLYLSCPHEAAPYLDTPLRTLFAAVLPRWLKAEFAVLDIFTFAADMQTQILVTHPYLLRQCVPILLKALACYPTALQPTFTRVMPALLPSQAYTFSPSVSPSSSPTSLILLASHILDLPILSLNLYFSSSEVSANLLLEEQDQAESQASMEEVLALLDEGFTGVAAESEGESEDGDSAPPNDPSSWLGRGAAVSALPGLPNLPGSLSRQKKGKARKGREEEVPGEAAARRIVLGVAKDRVEVDSMGFAVLAPEWMEEGVEEALRNEGRGCVKSWEHSAALQLRQEGRRQEKQQQRAGSKAENSPAKAAAEASHSAIEAAEVEKEAQRSNSFLGALKVAPALLGKLCRLVRETSLATALHVPAFLYLLILRFNHLFPSPPFQQRLQQCMLRTLSGFLRSQPELVLQLRGIVGRSISTAPLASQSRFELASHLCCLLSELVPGLVANNCASALQAGETLRGVTDLFDSVEVALFEALSGSRRGMGEKRDGEEDGNMLAWFLRLEQESGDAWSRSMRNSQFVQVLVLSVGRIGASTWSVREKAEVCLSKVTTTTAPLNPFIRTLAGDMLRAMKSTDWCYEMQNNDWTRNRE